MKYDGKYDLLLENIFSHIEDAYHHENHT